MRDFLGLLSYSSCKPQFGDFLKNIRNNVVQGDTGGIGGGGFLASLRDKVKNNPVLQERILQHRLNPCDGAAPQSCQCTDGQQFQFSLDYETNPCTGLNSVPDRCFCPNGDSFKPAEVAQEAADQFDIPTCGAERKPESCSCSDGSTFTFSLTGLGSGGRPCGGALPSSCTCQDGRVITARSVISRVIPALQELLG